MRRCVREQEVVRALRAGTLTPDLGNHVQGCPACAETERVARALMMGADGVCEDIRVPSVDAVWRRAQARSKDAALRRATRPLRAVQRLSVVCLAISALWVFEQFRGTLAQRFQEMGGWGGLTAGLPVSMSWIAVLFLLIVAGTWSLLYAGRTHGTEEHPSTS